VIPQAVDDQVIGGSPMRMLEREEAADIRQKVAVNWIFAAMPFGLHLLHITLNIHHET
jgi:hypothetical protein